MEQEESDSRISRIKNNFKDLQRMKIELDI